MPVSAYRSAIDGTRNKSKAIIGLTNDVSWG
jgi:hypothetical protein